MINEILLTAQAAAAHGAEVATGVSGNITQAVAGAGAAIGVGLIGSKAVEAVGRNPGAFGNILTLGIIAMALAEGLGILAFFVAK
ncbi:MAG: ATPase [Verrucomicrobiaceae bacterium]|nr:ATPase [Verrucomicrobiaceae bacterium]